MARGCGVCRLLSKLIVVAEALAKAAGHIDEDADEPDSAEREPNTAARKLLRQMLRAGVVRMILIR